MTDQRRKFIFFDATANHNKEWSVIINNDGTFTTEWGRVGSSLQGNTKPGSSYEVENLVRAKLQKGYREIQLATPRIVTVDNPSQPAISAKVAKLIQHILAEAGEAISGYLAVKVNELSIEQIQRGRALLDSARGFYRAQNFSSLVWTVRDYYNTIPTKLSSKLDERKLAHDFITNLDDTSVQLDQLEAAVAALTVTVTNQPSSALGNVKINDADATAADKIRRMITACIGRHGFSIRVSDVFEVEIPSERAKFNTCKVGNEQLLFHGTKAGNVRHIFNQGLIVPKYAASGRMFGDGIYFADQSSKSGQYCASNKSPLMMLVAGVKLGNSFTPTTTVNSAPSGYDSISAKGGFTSSLKNNEYIVYKTEQQTVRYLVTWERN